MRKDVVIKKLTNSNMGHMIHHNSVFSSDGQWIVFDGRNDETKIGETSTIGVVNVKTSEERIIYNTSNPTKYGPGVGAASFSPKENIVVFIHGLAEASELYPYDITRRFALGIAIDNPHLPIDMDARDVTSPYLLGALRGGTHSHCWNHDGTMLSFTYNDEFVEQDLRMVGVMISNDEAILPADKDGNKRGEKYSTILTSVARNPKNGSDEISKAFDECWLGDNNGVAFQGNTRNHLGQMITEIFVVGVDTALIKADKNTNGSKGTLPKIPNGIVQRRVSYTEKGLSDLRHWLRSSADGNYIYALAKDDFDRNQIVRCDVSTGEYIYLSDFEFSINSPININNLSNKVTFIANNNVYSYDLVNEQLDKLTNFSTDSIKLIGAPVFSSKDNTIAFNVLEKDNSNVQIWLLYH